MPLSSEEKLIQERAVNHIEGDSNPKLLFTCEHATNDVPQPWRGLGVAAEKLASHIGWDIGALDVTKALGESLNQPIITSGYSRLFFDVNRLPSSPVAIPDISDGYYIPGNQNISVSERDLRKALVYDPYIKQLRTIIRDNPSIKHIVSIHSCTPTFKGFSRPWEIGVLWQDNKELAETIIRDLNQGSNWCIGNNQPYTPSEHEISIQEVLAEFPEVTLTWFEIRNDLISTKTKATATSAILLATIKRIFKV